MNTKTFKNEIIELQKRELELTDMIAFCRRSFFEIRQGIQCFHATLEDVCVACDKAFNTITNVEELQKEIKTAQRENKS